jgi:hypothetical protein
MVDFAIIAPVPAMHLESAEEIARTRDYVSFGSNKWELFREVDELRGSEVVPVLLYASHDDRADPSYRVAWKGEYIGHVEQQRDKIHDERNGHRPATTLNPHDNASVWAAYWRVRNLQRLPKGEQVLIGELQGYKSGMWRKEAAPRGPEMIKRELWL